MSDQEIGKTFKIFIDDDGIFNIIFTEAIHDLESQARQAELVKEAVFEICRQNPDEKYNVLVDFSSVAASPSSSSRARKVYAELVSYKQTDKVAVISRQIFHKVVVSFIAKVTSRTIKWFSNKEKALEWFKQ